MAAPDMRVRGVASSTETHQANTYRDARSVITRLIEQMHSPSVMATAIFMIAGVAYFVPAISDLLLVVACLLTWWALTRHEDLPLKIPVQAKVIDPTTGKKAAGIFFAGNELVTGRQIWLSNDDCRQHMLVIGTTGAGKALPLDERVHTPTGWKRLGELKVGDRVSTPDGRSAEILGYYPQGRIEICRITFADGRTVEACPEHLWEVHHKHWNGKYRPGVPSEGKAESRILRTKEIEALLERNGGAFSVRLTDPVEKPRAELPIDPYLLGAMIGDGSLSGRSFTFSTRDDFLTDKMRDLFDGIGMDLVQHDSNAAGDLNVALRQPVGSWPSEFRATLRVLGLEGVLSHEKFIPEFYKNGSVAQRWQLVQGLMDTDGTADDRHGSLSFTTSSEQLARDVQEIVWSLGGIARISQRRPIFTGTDGTKKAGQVAHHVQIRHPDREKFFSLPQKVEVVARRPYQYANSLKLRIVSVERDIRQADAACILIDHPDHLFVTENYVVTHNTETLVGFAANALTWNSGYLYCDGKGDVSLFAKMYALARRFGREDDILVINFMTGNRDLTKLGGKLLSNSLNPFSSGSSDALVEMVVSLMDDTGGDGAMWKGRAEAMFTGVMRALVWLRDEQIIDLTVGAIRDHLNLRKIIDLADEKLYRDMPSHIRLSVRSYLTSLPGYTEEKGYKQPQTTLDQHGYLEMQFTRIFGSLADVYGHIFFTQSGEVDMYDVVLNRRLLVIMLPALEKSPSGIANLGKVVVANMKGMMGASLGSSIEGTYEEIVLRRSTNSPSPFVCIFDEVGLYLVEGMALMAAQARSLGFSLSFGAQDLPAMKKYNEKEALSVIGNTNTKFFMRTEEMEQTVNLAVQTAGKALQTRVGGFDGVAGEINTSYRDNFQASLSEVDRINPRDIRAQKPGEVTIISQDTVVRANTFFANPEASLDVNALRLGTNHFIKVPKPSLAEIEQAEHIPVILEHLLDPDFARQMKKLAAEALADLPRAAGRNDEIALFATSYELYAETHDGVPPQQAACAAIANTARAAGGLGDAFAAQMEARRKAQNRAGGPGPGLVWAGAEGAVSGGDPPGSMEVFDSDLLEDAGGPGGDGAAPSPDQYFAALVAETVAEPPDIDDDVEDAFGGGPPDPAGGEPPARPPVRPGLRPGIGAAQRRQISIAPVEHGVAMAGEKMNDVSANPGENDAVLRMLSNLDYDPGTTTTDQIEESILADMGGMTVDGIDDLSTAEEIDTVVARSEQVRGPEDTGPMNVGDNRLVSDFLSSLLDGETDGTQE